jgi:hypothetical protein
MLPSCIRLLTTGTSPLSVYTYTPTNNIRTLLNCMRTRPNYMRTLPNCVHELPNCTCTLTNCTRMFTDCMRLLPNHIGAKSAKIAQFLMSTRETPHLPSYVLNILLDLPTHLARICPLLP